MNIYINLSLPAIELIFFYIENIYRITKNKERTTKKEVWE